MRICYMFPGGFFKALTFSFDDGVVQDAKLIDIFNRNGLKGTFNFNTGLRRFREFDKEEFIKLYAGHEVACHGEFHPFFDLLPRTELVREVMNDRRKLEEITGSVITGLAYPNGSYSPKVIEILETCGIEYARTTAATMRTRAFPENFLAWHPTCHYRDAMELSDAFINETRPFPQVFYIWGHSYEFDRGVKDWQYMEDLAAKLGNRQDTWYVTNIELCRYLKAVRALQFSTDGKSVYNPTAHTIWFRIGWEGKPETYRVAPGETLYISEDEETM